VEPVVAAGELGHLVAGVVGAVVVVVVAAEQDAGREVGPAAT
jgi:hypothetical protein